MPRKKIDQNDPIEVANSKPIEEFIEDYLPPSPPWTTWTHPKTQSQFQVSLISSSALSTPEFEACFNLISETSSQDYKNSSDGWKPKSKRKEMKLLDLKYFLVKDGEQIKAFASLMPTYEDGLRVVYCYEIHLATELQGTGLGMILMKLLESIGKRIEGTAKTMLTCFIANKRGVRFYERLGYEKYEDTPGPRILRNGTKVECDYVILCKDIT